MKRSVPSTGKSALAPLSPNVSTVLELRPGQLLRPAQVIPALNWPICQWIDGERWVITCDVNVEGGAHE